MIIKLFLPLPSSNARLRHSVALLPLFSLIYTLAYSGPFPFSLADGLRKNRVIQYCQLFYIKYIFLILAHYLTGNAEANGTKKCKTYFVVCIRNFARVYFMLMTHVLILFPNGMNSEASKKVE